MEALIWAIVVVKILGVLAWLGLIVYVIKLVKDAIR